jgi:hypothetical protein
LKDKLTVYGFGSCFNGTGISNDIDILIIHESIDYDSCQFAIRCKRFFASNLDDTDITILSSLEERQINFIWKSSARFIGIVLKESEESDLREVLEKIVQAGKKGLACKCKGIEA